MFDWIDVECPYCGEGFETEVECGDDGLSYVEDCPVCCNPIAFMVRLGPDGSLLSVETRRENP